MAELGWQADRDEGIRLLATTDRWLGIDAALRMPMKFASPAPESYFNFYLGINESARGGGGRKIEAGISYSEKAKKYGGVAGWRLFLHNNGTSQHRSIAVKSGGTIDLSLRFNGNAILLNSSAGAGLSSIADFRRGAPKMCIAIHEDHANLADRTTWFDTAALICTGIWNESDRSLTPTGSGIRFGYSALNPKKILSISSDQVVGCVMRNPR